MTTVTVRDARSRFAAILDQVSRGQTISITRRGKEVARLVPATPPKQPTPDWAARRAALIAQGVPVTENTVCEMREEERW
jgi:prevent-host-death family protein